MTTQRFAILASLLVTLPSLSFAQEQVVVPPEHKLATPTIVMPAFPPSNKCSSSSPCRNIMGEVQRIEESYWITLPDGNLLHVKASEQTKMQDLPKVGDKVAAQITSTGDAEAIMKVPDVPKPTDLPIPSKSFRDLR